MEIAPSTTSFVPTTQANADASVINSDFETFLKMLTAQMENQDPLNPLDAQDFATQLATFSGVEQQVRTNQLLTALSSQMVTASLGDMATWVGMEARLSGPVSFDGAPIDLHPTPPALSDSAELLVKDEAGNVVQRLATPLSDEPISWAGVGEDGQPLPNGRYSFTLIGYAGSEIAGETIPESFVRVAEVKAENGQAMIVTQGGASYTADSVKGLR